jgi:glutamyl-tRNA reductase
LENERALRMKFFVVGLNHNTAPVKLREQLAVNFSDVVSRARHLKRSAELDEIVLLSTCNRVEIYATTSRQCAGTSALLSSLCVDAQDFRPNPYIYEDFDAARHLFRVATGLDSMVIGETEITGQVKKAYEVALGAQLTGATLNRVFQKAFQVVKEIRTQTRIGRGSTSVGGVAVELAGRIFQHDLSKQTILIIGAGQVGEACVRHLAKKGARAILVSNRSFDRAKELAGEFGGRAVRFEDCLSTMVGADIIVAATGLPKTLLHRVDVENAMLTRRNRSLILIDLAVPRNIDAEVQLLDNVYLYNIDDLEAIVRENVSARGQELALCNQIIEARASALMEKLNCGKERPYEAGLQLQSNWLSQGPAIAAA